jgi:hypothetical protein
VLITGSPSGAHKWPLHPVRMHPAPVRPDADSDGLVLSTSGDSLCAGPLQAQAETEKRTEAMHAVQNIFRGWRMKFS